MHWLVTYPEDGPSVAFYLAWLAQGGIAPTLVPKDYPHPGEISPFDALLLPGGGDVDPARYGATRLHPAAYEVSARRDALELRLIAEFLAAGRPVFGICRGAQILNVALGGALIQHLPDILAADLGEFHAKQNGYDSRHGLCLEPGAGGARAMAGLNEVNSAHHQALDPAGLGRGLRVTARSPAGVIEAVEADGSLPASVAAVQWHPERMPADHPGSASVRDWFLSLVR
jgi:putative glutamine amidotransferase